jgi:biopolymer transport protein ExbD
MRWTLRILLVATAVLTLGLRVSKRLNHKPLGLSVKLIAHTSLSQCGDSDVIVLQLLNDRSFRINSESIPIENLRGQLREIFRSRAERVLLVRADPEVSFQEVVTAIDIAQGAISNLYVALLTPEAEREPCFYITRRPELPNLPR